MNSDLNTESNIPSNDNSNNINKQSAGKPQDSFVKLAMRNMVKKGSTSLFHFSLTIFGVIATLLGLAIIFH
ncbi:DUF3285 domain-containing protein [Pseudanabaena sp. ABRG5-3]|uniref:DUF3285 domain-containing protein n=1 Tax=Pseudanabaena sp. ABRG5-3 TaxID=685565 RepID=UPI000DC73D02|nr:DUF3285 domain-containing protein [Pseudanabaena sp. ABRG5-3]BBC25043.1 hypothetical protein ABRG53_2786 [Pseudanabaena sp. ABRG5-3]